MADETEKNIATHFGYELGLPRIIRKGGLPPHPAAETYEQLRNHGMYTKLTTATNYDYDHDDNCDDDFRLWGRHPWEKSTSKDTLQTMPN